ncbi:DMT family transporter [Acuticoccus sp. MNP-M23]|uniref:DMT family transporter n=1 Tax=Acuticoccus sp. MNP-M23 TaxID=3072793 RepID=UPI002814C665|nr:DMT family transporter [Acuticoccus sp. MNP-M23]WMS44038.1 DMT family transporter [Acuticoccus sp. MNP-M23]
MNASNTSAPQDTAQVPPATGVAAVHAASEVIAVPAHPAAPAVPAARPLLAVGLIALASALVAMTTVLAKALGTPVLGAPLHPLQITNGRFLFALGAVALVAAAVRAPFTRPALPLHALRAVCGFSTVTLMFMAATLIPLADATAISFLSPVVTLVLAGLILRERVGRWRWIATLIALSGAFVLLRPGEGAMSLGAVAALGAALFMGLELTIIKRLSGREPLLQILLLANVFGLILSSVAVLPVWRMPTPGQWLALWALGTLMLGAQMCYTAAMKRADASFVAPVGYTTLIFAAVYDIAIFSVWPDLVSVAGAGLILAGALVLTTRAQR